MAERKLPMGAKEIGGQLSHGQKPQGADRSTGRSERLFSKGDRGGFDTAGRNEADGAEKPNPRKIDVDAAAARELLEQGMTDEEAASALGVGTHKFAEWRREEGIKPNRKAAAPQETAEHDTGGKEQSESAEMVGGHAEPYVTVAKLHDILTAALAGKMGHAAVTVQGQRFRSMALRISYTIGGEDQGPTAELVTEPLE